MAVLIEDQQVEWATLIKLTTSLKRACMVTSHAISMSLHCTLTQQLPFYLPDGDQTCRMHFLAGHPLMAVASSHTAFLKTLKILRNLKVLNLDKQGYCNLGEKRVTNGTCRYPS